MSGSFQNKISKYEEAPPPSAWENISQRLDNEFNAADAGIATKLADATVAPPASAWQNIASTIGAGDTTEIQTPQRTLVSPVYRRLAAAAAVLVLLAVGAFYLMSNGNNADESVADNRTLIDGRENAVRPAPLTQIPAADSVEVGVATLEPTNDNIGVASRNSRARTPEKRQPPAEPREAYAQFADFHLEPRPVRTAAAALQQVEADAPPLRDAHGNVIMDFSIISNPNEPYITVTGPNGEQTKISNKFLHFLRYMNDDYPASEINPDDREWLSTFEQWRNKLLSEGSFVPAANNFFDIFELKELLEEN